MHIIFILNIHELSRIDLIFRLCKIHSKVHQIRLHNFICDPVIFLYGCQQNDRKFMTTVKFERIFYICFAIFLCFCMRSPIVWYNCFTSSLIRKKLPLTANGQSSAISAIGDCVSFGTLIRLIRIRDSLGRTIFYGLPVHLKALSGPLLFNFKIWYFDIILTKYYYNAKMAN